MPLDPSRIQGFGSDDVVASAEKCESDKDSDEEGSDEESAKGRFWKSVQGFKESFSGPAANSAYDNASLRVTDAMGAVQQDVSEMGLEFKTFVSGALGIAPRAVSEDDGDTGIVERIAAPEPAIPAGQRSEATQLISSFCENYPPGRVKPSRQELDNCWVRCSVLSPSASASAIYDTLSWQNGDLAWQPRLRALHLIEHLYYQGAGGREITNAVVVQAAGLLQHLASEQVPQCQEQGNKVILVLKGMVPDPSPPAPTSVAAGAAPQAAVSSPPKAKVQTQDLLDLTDPGSAPVTATNAPLAGALQARNIKEVTLQPGPLNLRAKFDVGLVTAVDAGQAQSAGVQPGWKIMRVDGKPYDAALLDEKIAGKAPYIITFTTLAQAASGGSVDLLSNGGLPAAAPPIFDLTAPVAAPAPALAPALAAPVAAPRNDMIDLFSLAPAAAPSGPTGTSASSQFDPNPQAANMGLGLPSGAGGVAAGGMAPAPLGMRMAPAPAAAPAFGQGLGRGAQGYGQVLGQGLGRGAPSANSAVGGFSGLGTSPTGCGAAANGGFMGLGAMVGGGAGQTMATAAAAPGAALSPAARRKSAATVDWNAGVSSGSAGQRSSDPFDFVSDQFNK